MLPLQIVAVTVLKHFPQFVETYYSNGLYPILSQAERLGLGWLPFSFGDFLYAILVIFLIRWLIIRFKTRFRKPLAWFLEAIATLSIIYACFNLFWGFNYYRLPMHQALNIKDDYTSEELINLTNRLIERSNELQFQLTQNDSQKVDFPFKNYEIRKLAMEGYDHLSKQFPKLTYRSRSVKPSLFKVGS